MSVTSTLPSSGRLGGPILIVDDEAMIRMSLAAYLRESGYLVIEANDAAEAKALLQADHGIDLVFSDINMPGPENGFVLAAWVREHRGGTAVILTSSVDYSGAETDGNGAIVPKPYLPEVVLARIEALLAARLHLLN